MHSLAVRVSAPLTEGSAIVSSRSPLLMREILMSVGRSCRISNDFRGGLEQTRRQRPRLTFWVFGQNIAGSSAALLSERVSRAVMWTALELVSRSVSLDGEETTMDIPGICSTKRGTERASVC